MPASCLLLLCPDCRLSAVSCCAATRQLPALTGTCAAPQCCCVQCTLAYRWPCSRWSEPPASGAHPTARPCCPSTHNPPPTGLRAGIAQLAAGSAGTPALLASPCFSPRPPRHAARCACCAELRGTPPLRWSPSRCTTCWRLMPAQQGACWASISTRPPARRTRSTGAPSRWVRCAAARAGRRCPPACLPAP